MDCQYFFIKSLREISTIDCCCKNVFRKIETFSCKNYKSFYFFTVNHITEYQSVPSLKHYQLGMRSSYQCSASHAGGPSNSCIKTPTSKHHDSNQDLQRSRSQSCNFLFLLLLAKVSVIVPGNDIQKQSSGGVL